jgi:hypothetical protein
VLFQFKWAWVFMDVPYGTSSVYPQIDKHIVYEMPVLV